MKTANVFMLTLVALMAFAGNSLLCRMALRNTLIDPAGFTFLRIASGAILLWSINALRGKKPPREGGWLSATMLFLYAGAFSFAYTRLSAGSGALLLFGAVQATMITWGLIRGERLHLTGIMGLLLALSGLVGLAWPGVSSPPLFASISMLAAGVAWGIYSLRGRTVIDPLAATAGNFVRAVPLAIALSLVFWPQSHWDRAGAAAAVISGAITSGLGYLVWYRVLPFLGAIRASILQLCVPILTAIAGIGLLNETPSARLALTGVAVLIGVALAIFQKPRAAACKAA